MAARPTELCYGAAMGAASKSNLCRRLFGVVVVFAFASASVADVDNLPQKTSLVGEESNLILVSTLNGWLRAVDPRTGELKWSLKEEPVVRVPVEVRAGFTFLPDPQDGSLYLLREGRLKKLPFTIPQLVQASPCKSSDGVLYAGSKKDVWIGIDLKSGQKLETLSQDASERVCPAAAGSGPAVFIGRTEYSISMFEGPSRERRWNGTFTDYSSHALPEDLFYELGHYASSSDGRVLTVERDSGTILWEADLGAGSPVVALYILEGDGLHRLPFTSIGNETLNSLIRDSGSSAGGHPYISRLADVVADSRKLYPTLYVGETEHGLYALPSLVDSDTVTILPSFLGTPLIEGPSPLAGAASAGPPDNRVHVNPDVRRAEANGRTREGELLLLGYHEEPEMIRHGLLSTLPKYSQAVGPSLWRTNLGHSAGPRSPHVHTGRGGKKQSFIIEDSTGQIFRAVKESEEEDEWNVFRQAEEWWYGRSSKQGYWLLVSVSTTFCLFLTVLFLLCRRDGGGGASSGGGSRGRSSGSGRLAFWRHEPVVPDGWVPIGKILFNPARILGRGCEGTVVYEGQFDGRNVAVKRVVSDFMNLADREVDLLRESDTHSNVIRYFCMEADSQFRYIALELCWGTLSDWVEHDDLRRRCVLTPPRILRQATDGLAHLHSLKIVHRDIKPQNVLFTASVKGDCARVIISDFGLCKRITFGRNSISKRSGVAGTDGWIAPEVLVSDHSVTTSVDMFSLGCVFHYVVTSGQHPFGDSLHRQANIISHQYSMEALADDGHALVSNLISSLLNKDPMLRPSAAAVLKHPYFWEPAKILAFFQEVSDRVEKEEHASPVLRSLESGARAVVKNDWRQHICPALQADLRKFRTYRGSSVRDLLRALRNKRHHYRELPTELRTALGHIPDGFVGYFTGRFPGLLGHAYDSMRCVGEEKPFQAYYDQLPSAFLLSPAPAPPPLPPADPPADWEDKSEASIERIRPRADAEKEESLGHKVQFRPGNTFPESKASPKPQRSKAT